MAGPRITPNQAVEVFLAYFDGDPTLAMNALEAYQHRQSMHKARTVYTSTGPVLVNLQNVKKTYKIGQQRITALDGVSMQVHEGEFVALTGASGSGKSTLLQLIGGLDKPNDGTIEVDGTNLNKLSDSKLSTFRGQTIGFVFQFFYLQPFLRINKNLEVPAMFARTAYTQRQIKAQELAEAVNISDRLQHFPRELSGGQMQRAAIARALMNQPKLLLADEPTGNLDSANGEAIISLFEQIRKQFGTTIIVVTHDPTIAARADREITLKDGAII